MICSQCGKEIEIGQVYCPHCGKMQQLVPDYFEAEEEILNDTGLGRTDPDEEERAARRRAARRKKAEAARRKRRRNRIILICCAAAVLLAVIIGVAYYRNHRYNSYDVQMTLARDAYEDEAYEKAIKHAKRALTLNGSSVDARILLYRAYLKTGEEDLSLLEEVLELDPENTDAYALLIAYYDGADDYDALLTLALGAPSDEILALFDGYLTAAPEITPEEGTYEHNTEVTIESDDTVYYTTDGSTPTTSSDVYEESFELESGTWTVSAIAVDEDGRSSLVSTATYVIDPQAPSSVTFSPSGGSYDSVISITLSADEGCTIYYAWDTTNSYEITTEYTGAIKIIEGNHILSAIAVSEDGIESEVSSKSFIYISSDDDGESAE